MTTTTNDTTAPGGTRNFDELFGRVIENNPSLAKVMELHPKARPNINNDIHPIFRRSNFPTLNDEQYDGMKLALRLASLLVSVDTLLEWWVHAAYDFEVPHPDYTNVKMLEQQMDYNDGHTAAVSAAIHNLADFITFDFDIFPDFVSCGRTQPVLNRKPRCRRDDTHSLFRDANRKHLSTKTFLHSHFRDYAGGAYATDPLPAQLRFSFYLAATIVHETTHAFGIMVRGHANEPLFYAHAPETDWGFAWEVAVLGAQINPWDSATMAPTTTLMANEWIGRQEARQARRVMKCVVPMDWVARWFRRSFWLRLQQGTDLRTAPLSAIFVWQLANRRGSLVSEIELPEHLRELHRGRTGTKRKAGEVSGDEGDGPVEAGEEPAAADDESRRKRRRMEIGESAKVSS